MALDLYVASCSGQLCNAAGINTRGVGTLGERFDLLYVVDGISIESAVFRTLNPGDFKSVYVLKYTARASSNGSRGANGEIVINTRRSGNLKPQFQNRGWAGKSEPPSNNI